MTATASSRGRAGDEIALFSRSGLDWTVRFPAIAKALESLPCDSALLDGEIAFVLPSGLTSFKSLQEHIDTPHPAFRYFLFDLLSLDGKDMRKEPLIKRKERLQHLLTEKKLPDWLVYSDHVVGSGAEFYRGACDAGLEGVVSKRRGLQIRLRPHQELAQDQMRETRGARDRRL